MHTSENPLSLLCDYPEIQERKREKKSILRKIVSSGPALWMPHFLWFVEPWGKGSSNGPKPG